MQSIILTVIVLVVKCSSEPHCSKYHYEEKLLEKMIRTEILVESMKTEVEDIKNEVKESLAKLTEETNNWKAEIKKMQEDNQIQLTELSEKASTALDKKIQQVEDMKGKTVSPNVAFSAKTVKDARPGTGNVIVFTDTILNLGEAYSTETGVFTAQHGGTYLFTVQLCMDGSKYIDYGLVVDDVYMNIARYSDNYSSARCYGSATTAYAKPGNKIWVKVINHSSSGLILYDNKASYWNTFTGVLIRAD